MQPIKPTVAIIDHFLKQFYQLKNNTSAVDFVKDRQILCEHFGEAIRSEPNFSARGSLWLRESGDETEMAITFSDEIVHKVSSLKPHEALNRDNMDAFLVVVEEVSHFNLLLERLGENRQTGALEMELQAEIDKILMSAMFLMQQGHTPHLSSSVTLASGHLRSK